MTEVLNRFQAIEKRKNRERIECNDGSLTSQGQAMSMRQIIQKYKVLGAAPISKPIYYDEEIGLTEMPITETRGFDLADFSAESKRLEAEAKILAEIRDENARKKAEDELNAKIDAAASEKIKAQQSEEKGA